MRRIFDEPDTYITPRQSAFQAPQEGCTYEHRETVTACTDLTKLKIDKILTGRMEVRTKSNVNQEAI